MNEIAETPKERKWVWWSTPKTAYALRPSVLAIAETIACMSAYLWIGVAYETYLHLLIAALVAPTVLLSFPRDREKQVQDFLEKGPQSDPLDFLLYKGYGSFFHIVPSAVFFFVVNIQIIIYKIRRTISNLISQFIDTISAIPSNWFRFVLCTDVHHPPEFFPGMELHSRLDKLRFNTLFFKIFVISPLKYWLRKMRLGTDEHPIETKVYISIRQRIYQLLMVIAFCSFFAPVFVYRFTIKGTAIIWLPLVYLSSPEKVKRIQGGLSLEEKTHDKLDDIRNGIQFKLALALSFLTISAGAIKIFLNAEWTKYRELWIKYAPSFLDSLIAPLYLYPWQITAISNSILAWLLFVWADGRYRRFDRYDPKKMNFCLDVTKKFRVLLSITTIFGLFVFIAQIVELISQVNFRWALPWD
jgi:hypothetical protein